MKWEKAYNDVLSNNFRDAYNEWAQAACGEATTFELNPFEVMVVDDLKGKLFDVGCGNGRFAATLLKNQIVSSVRAIDVSDVCIGHTKKAFEVCQVQGQIVRESIEAYSTEDKFDTITCWEVLEHLRRPHLTLALFTRILEKDGAVVGSVPEGLAHNNVLHLHHFYAEDLQAMLREHFNDIRIIRYYWDEPKTTRLIFVGRWPRRNTHGIIARQEL